MEQIMSRDMVAKIGEMFIFEVKNIQILNTSNRYAQMQKQNKYFQTDFYIHSKIYLTVYILKILYIFKVQSYI